MPSGCSPRHIPLHLVIQTEAIWTIEGIVLESSTSAEWCAEHAHNMRILLAQCHNNYHLFLG